MKTLLDYVKVYDGILDKSDCYQLIDLYNSNEPLHQKYETGRPSFTQLNVTQYYQDHNLHKKLIDASNACLERYIEDNICWFPEHYGFEEFRLKKYACKSDDRFDTHVDVGDYSTARRFLVFFFYLNDVKIGGETEMTTLGKSIKPKQGSVLMFPPTWMYPHKANRCISNDKYIIGSYLHYL